MLRLRNRTAALLLVCILYTGCGRAYVIHPGAVNTFDSQTYDVLIAAKETIRIGRAQLESGVLTQAAKPTLNALILAYDAAYPIYLTYHDAASSGKPTDQYLADLKRNLEAVSRALTAFRGGR